MRVIRIILIFMLLFAIGFESGAQEQFAGEQQFSEFNLVSYGEKGKKLWEIDGKSADILSDIVKLTQIVANVYGEEDINIQAESGSFDKNENRMHLEKNVVITTNKGAKLVTDSLDWDRKAELITTKDTVNLESKSMVAVGQGAQAEPNLKKFNLEKEVKVQIRPEDENISKKDALKNRIDITCDGPMEVDYNRNLAVFKNKVCVDDGSIQLYSDTMDVYFNTSSAGASKQNNDSGMGGSIEKIIAKGNVKIVRGENTSFSQEATYLAKDKRLILSGRPKLVIYSTEGINASP